MVTGTHLLTATDQTITSLYTTASISPAANQLVLLAVSSTKSTSLATPTVTGAGMTWTFITSTLDVSGSRQINLYRALSSSPSSGALTIDFGGVNQSRASWTIAEFSGVNTDGTNGASAVVQVATNSVTAIASSMTVNLAAFASTLNATYGAVRLNTNQTITAGTGFTELGQDDGSFSSTQSQWRNDNDTSVDWSWTSGSLVALGVAVEIAAALTPSPSETSTITENTSLSILGTGLNINVSDGPAITDSLALNGPRNVSVSDTSAVTEHVVAFSNKIDLNISETIGFSEQTVITTSQLPSLPPVETPQGRRQLVQTRIEILDSNLNLLTWIKAPYPLNKGGTILRYSKELSDFGTARFRVSSYDSMFTTLGDVLKPHANHVRIRRDNVVVWQGAIIENPLRTKDFIEVTAAEYVWYLGKKLIARTSNNPATGAADGIYRIFNSGGMDEQVTAIMNEVTTAFAGTNHALASLTVGTIQNPNYPPNMTNANGSALTGAWRFGDGTAAPQLTFDFHSVLYVLKSFGAYSYTDFNIDSNMQFNFKKFLGTDRHSTVSFVWGEHGNAVDFNVTRLGQRMVNDLWGIAVDNDGKILHVEQSDQTSIKANGFLEQVSAYSDVKDQATLNARVQAELPFISTSDSSADNFVLSEKAYPLGVYDVGDIITAKVNHIAISYNEVKRIVGVSVDLNSTGRELTTVQLNTPLANQFTV